MKLSRSGRWLGIVYVSINFVSTLTNPVKIITPEALTFAPELVRHLHENALAHPSDLLLAATVLASGMGVGIIEHWCLMKGYSKTTLLAEQPCKPTCRVDNVPISPSDQPSLNRAACCKTTLTYQHVDVNSVVADASATLVSPALAYVPLPQFQFLLAALLVTDVPATAPLVADDPLHRTGRFRLTSLCGWLI
ncbi:hypothetical protein ACAW74_27815 [Fibrella sp. WM1]|uniref:hypothetical protein n=1 Tax=Fibrella musci TaxID=3242485 RepID=UPI003521E53E